MMEAFATLRALCCAPLSWFGRSPRGCLTGNERPSPSVVLIGSSQENTELPNTSSTLFFRPRLQPLGSLTLLLNIGARNCSRVVLLENKPDVITEQRGDAETKQYRDEEHKQKMILFSVIFNVILIFRCI